jgi:hypothetical protein
VACGEVPGLLKQISLTKCMMGERSGMARHLARPGRNHLAKFMLLEMEHA